MDNWKTEEFFVTVCECVANGGSLISLCKVKELVFGRVSTWINQDEGRKERYKQAKSDREEWAKEKVYKEIKRLASVDIRKLFRPGGAVKEPDDWGPELGGCIASFKVMEDFDQDGNRGYVKDVKFYDKLKALEMLGKAVGLFAEKVQLEAGASLEALVRESYKPPRIAAGAIDVDVVPVTEPAKGGDNVK